MSSNTEIDISPRVEPERFNVSSQERFSLAALSPGGAKCLRTVLERLTDGAFPAEVRARFPWQRVVGQENSFRCRIGAYSIVLSLQGSVPRLDVTGVQVKERELPASVMQSAHQAVNQVLALAVTERIAHRLTAYAEERIAEVTRNTVSQTVAIKALQLQNARLALRASCQIRVAI